MRILICSYAFSPSVGGLEAVSEMLAGAFARAGHEVAVVTQSAGPNDERPFRVIRQPSVRELWSLYQWTEVVFQNNLSTRLLWPNFLLAKPCIVTTQTWLSGVSDVNTRTSRLKRAILRRCRNVAISEAVAQHIGHPSIVLGNPYDAETFRRLPNVQRNGELLFVGRLVSDKGLDLLLRALGRLRSTGLAPTLTVVGEGPDRAENEELVEKLGLDRWIKFMGVVRGTQLARLMNAHRILVVPSRWAEPFGIVALEGIACGCVVVGSEAGGLREAIGPCGWTVPNGDVQALTETLRRVLADPDECEEMRMRADSHLEKFQLANISASYLALFREALQ
jgi:glycosyltransferase involved in cell wall biosynthesis